MFNVGPTLVFVALFLLLLAFPPLEAAAVMHDRGEVVHPEPEWTAIYEGLYASWVDHRARFEQTVARVSDLG